MLRIRHLYLSINSDRGPFGARQSFGDGLNVIRAENSAGKSQLLQAIIYALGLEGMLSPSTLSRLPMRLRITWTTRRASPMRGPPSYHFLWCFLK